LSHEIAEYQRVAGGAAVDAGADVVAGSHPHVGEGVERYGDGLILHSLGNFVFGRGLRREATREGPLARVEVDGHRPWRCSLRDDDNAVEALALDSVGGARIAEIWSSSTSPRSRGARPRSFRGSRLPRARSAPWAGSPQRLRRLVGRTEASAARSRSPGESQGWLPMCRDGAMTNDRPTMFSVRDLGGHSVRRPSVPRNRSLVALCAAVAAIAAGAAPAGAAPDNLGTDFHLGFMRNLDGGAQKTLFITGPTATTGRVTVDGLGFSRAFTVTPGEVTSVPLPVAAEMPRGEGLADVAVHVTAAAEVTVYGFSHVPSSTDAYLGLPTDVMDGTYTVMSWPSTRPARDEFAFVATEDDTTVTIVATTVTEAGHIPGFPYQVTLDAGQMYQVQAVEANEGLTGTTLQANKRIAVFAGHECVNVPATDFDECNHVVEQLPPTARWGTSFLTVPLKTRIGGDTFKFLAAENDTTVRVNGTPVATLGAGESALQIIEGTSAITADKPILVAQFSNSSTYDGVTSDPFMMLVPPVAQFQTGYTVTTPAEGFPSNFLNIVAPDAEAGSIRVDGTVVPAAAFSPIGTSGFRSAQVDVGVGRHNVTGSGRPFGVLVYGFAPFDAYGYPAGISFAPDGGGGGGGGGGEGAGGAVTPPPPASTAATPSVPEPAPSGPEAAPSVQEPAPTSTTTTAPSQTPRRRVLRPRLLGTPSRGCLSAASVRVRARVRGIRSGLRVRVLLDSKVIARSTRRTFVVTVPIGGLRSGRHRLVISASGPSARTSTRRYTLRKCSAVSPSFTG